jgi:hypothetical protein
MMKREYPGWLKWVCVANEQETNVSCYQHSRLVDLLFEESGYSLVDENRDGPLSQKDLDRIAEQVMGGDMNTDVLRGITHKEFEDIQLRVERGIATENDKLKLSVGMFHKMFRVRQMDVDGLDVPKHFHIYLRKRSELESKIKTIDPR